MDENTSGTRVPAEFPCSRMWLARVAYRLEPGNTLSSTQMLSTSNSHVWYILLLDDPREPRLHANATQTCHARSLSTRRQSLQVKLIPFIENLNFVPHNEFCTEFSLSALYWDHVLCVCVTINKFTSRQNWPTQTTTRVINTIISRRLFTWLWRWLLLRWSKRQSPTTVLLFPKTTLTRTITQDKQQTTHCSRLLGFGIGPRSC